MLPGAIAFIIGGISVYLIQKFEKPKLSALGFFVNAVFDFCFHGKRRYFACTSLCRSRYNNNIY